MQRRKDRRSASRVQIPGKHQRQPVNNFVPLIREEFHIQKYLMLPFYKILPPIQLIQKHLRLSDQNKPASLGEEEAPIAIVLCCLACATPRIGPGIFITFTFSFTVLEKVRTSLSLSQSYLRIQSINWEKQHFHFLFYNLTWGSRASTEENITSTFYFTILLEDPEHQLSGKDGKTRECEKDASEDAQRLVVGVRLRSVFLFHPEDETSSPPSFLNPNIIGLTVNNASLDINTAIKEPISVVIKHSQALQVTLVSSHNHSLLSPVFWVESDLQLVGLILKHVVRQRLSFFFRGERSHPDSVPVRPSDQLWHHLRLYRAGK